MPPPTSPVPTEVVEEEGPIEEEPSAASSGPRTGSLTAVGSQGTRASSLPEDILRITPEDDLEAIELLGPDDGVSYLEHQVPRSFRPSAWTGHWKMGMPRCATDNCPYACTDPNTRLCCRWCGNKDGKHGNTCAKSWHVPAVSEWMHNDWLADGMPTKYALLLPNERKAFNRIRRSPEEFNSFQSVELLEGLTGWLRTNVPENTVTPPASDDGVQVVPRHLHNDWPVYTHNATVWGFILPIVVAHDNGWTRQDHYGSCGQSCPCCRSHNREDAMGCCDECYDGWVLTCVCKSFYIYILDIAQGYYASVAASIQPHSPAPLAIEVGPDPAPIAPMERASQRLGLYHRLDQLKTRHWHRYLEERSVNQDLLRYLKSPHRKELMRARDWKVIFGKSIVESKPAERREKLAPSASSLKAASETDEVAFQDALIADIEVLLDASSLTAAGSSDEPPMNPRPTISVGVKAKSRPSSNKIPAKNVPSAIPSKSTKSKASPRSNSRLRCTPSVACANAWERVIHDHVDNKAPTQRQIFRKHYTQNSMPDGILPDWPAGLSRTQFLKYAFPWMQAAGLKGTNTILKIDVRPFNAWSEPPRSQTEFLAIVVLDEYLFLSMPETGQWYKMYDENWCSESELVLISRALTWYTRVVGSNPNGSWKSGDQWHYGTDTFLAKGGYIEIDHAVDLLRKDGAVQAHSRLRSLDHDKLKAVVRTLVANGTYEVGLGARNCRYAMVEYAPLLNDDWQHPRPDELTWVCCRQGHANYGKLQVCQVTNVTHRQDKTSSLTAGDASSSLTAGGSKSPSARPIRKWKGSKQSDSNFLRQPFLIRPAMYEQVCYSDFGPCQNPNPDGRGEPMGITWMTHATSSLNLPKIWKNGLRIMRQRCIMLSCHPQIAAAFKSSREDADLNIHICYFILRKWIYDGRIKAWFAIFSHTLIIELDLSNSSESALHCLPNTCFRELAVKHVSPVRECNVTLFRRHPWMDRNLEEYAQFDLPAREDGGPTYLRRVWQRCNRFMSDDIKMHIDGRHQDISKEKKEAHYVAVKEGCFECYACNKEARPGWDACYNCKAPLTEHTAEQQKLVADTYIEFLRLETLLTGERVASRSSKSQKNHDRSKFERDHWEASINNAKAVGADRAVHNGPIKHQFRHLIDSEISELKPDLKKKVTTKALSERAEIISKHGFGSHEQCYWGCGEYRIRCEQSGGKGECVGPKFFVKFTDPTGCVPSGVHTFDVIATANYTVAFPLHLNRIRDFNAATEKSKLETSHKRAPDSSSTTRWSKRPNSWQHLESQASSSRDIAVNDGGRAASRQSDYQHVPSENYEWQASSSSSWYGGRAASQQSGHQASYFQSDYETAYLQSPANSTWFWHENWKESDEWKEKRW